MAKIAVGMESDATKFARLVDKYRELGAANPERVQAALARHILVGNLVLFGGLFGLPFVLAFIVAAMMYRASVIYLFLFFGIGVVWLAMAKSAFSKMPFPNGTPLHPELGGFLYGEVDAVAKSLGLPKIDAVAANPFSSIEAVDWRRYCFFGKTKRVVVVGVPCLCLLTRTELRALLTRELGKYAGGSRQMMRAVGNSVAWSSVLTHLEGKGGIPANILGNFIKSYLPELRAMLLADLRRQVFECDAQGAEATGRHEMVRALMKQATMGELWMDPAYQSVIEDAKRRKGRQGFSDIINVLETSEPPSIDRAEKVVRSALSAPDDPYDEMPSLKARLEKLGLDVAFMKDRIDEQALSVVRRDDTNALAELALGDKPRFVEAVDEAWSEAFAGLMAERADAHAAALEELDALIKRAETTPLNADEYANLVATVKATRGNSEALEYADKALRCHPDDKHLKFLHAVLHLEADEEDQEAKEVLERFSAGGDREYGQLATQMLRTHAQKTGDDAGAQALHDQEHQSKQEALEIEEEFSQLAGFRFLAPVELTADQRDAIGRAAESIGKRLRRVHVFERHSNYNTAYHKTCLLLVMARPFVSEDLNAQFNKWAAHFYGAIPGDWMIYCAYDKLPLTEEKHYPIGSIVWKG